MCKRCFFIALLLLGAIQSIWAQTQLEMNESAHSAYLAADKKLNSIYQKIIADYKEDKIFIANLKKSQRLWLQFRDAEMKMKYPDRESGYYGSIHNLCWSEYLTELTEERIKKLNYWIDGANEGDACSGSIKIK